MSLIHEVKYKVVSMSDMLGHPKFKEYSEEGEGGVQKILYEMGIDTDRDWEETFCTHRSEVTNDVVTCARYVGYEREDQQWKNLMYRIRGY